LLELGGIVYCQQAGRAPADADAKVSDLITQLHQHEAEHGPISVTSATLLAPAAPDGGSFVPTPTQATDTPEQPSTPAATTVAGGGGIPQSSGGIPTGTYSSDTEETS